MRFEKLETGFYVHDGRVFFAFPHGEWTLVYEVIGGVILCGEDAAANVLPPHQTVQVLEKEDWPLFGITEETLNAVAEV